MSNAHTSKTVLVTGANAGLGFAAARQFARGGWGRVMISARSDVKALDAIERLVAETGRSRESFGHTVFDNNHPDTVAAAVASLVRAGERFDAVVLNAGGIAAADAQGRPPLTPRGMTEMYAMNVHGHSVLIHGLIDAGRLVEGATVMLAGSEASRGISAMGVAAATLPEGFGDLDATLDAVTQGRHAEGYDAMHDYGLVKLIGTVWMRQLRDAYGLRALTVSPGFTGGTDALKKVPALQRFLYRYVAYPLMRLMGNAHGLETGARRYVQALEDDSLQAGEFYASPRNRISGELVAQSPEDQPLLADAEFESAVQRLIARQLSAAAVAA